MIGTLLSIVTGVLTVYQNTIRQAYEDNEQLYHSFEGYIQQINEADQKITVISNSTDPQSVKVGQIQAANTIKFVTGTAAEQILPKIGNFVTASQYALLAEAEATVMVNFAAARGYIAKAISNCSPPVCEALYVGECRGADIGVDAESRL